LIVQPQILECQIQLETTLTLAKRIVGRGAMKDQFAQGDPPGDDRCREPIDHPGLQDADRQVETHLGGIGIPEARIEIQERPAIATRPQKIEPRLTAEIGVLQHQMRHHEPPATIGLRLPVELPVAPVEAQQAIKERMQIQIQTLRPEPCRAAILIDGEVQLQTGKARLLVALLETQIRKLAGHPPVRPGRLGLGLGQIEVQRQMTRPSTWMALQERPKRPRQRPGTRIQQDAQIAEVQLRKACVQTQQLPVRR
jgi:hypothetical protein